MISLVAIPSYLIHNIINLAIMWKRIVSISQLPQLSSRTVQRPQLRAAIIKPDTVTISRTRGFHVIPTLQGPRKQDNYNDQQDFDRKVLNPEKSEGTVSGTDSEIAKYPTAYDPTKTSPEREMRDTEKESQQDGKPGGPLDVSGANKDVNVGNEEKGAGPTQNADTGAHSTRGVTQKHGKGPRSS